MKVAKIALLAVVVVLVSLLFAPSAEAGVSFSFFYSNLSPHGSWQISAQYGHVWQPQVYTSGWNPYYDGHWVYSDLGWAWVSDYAWGSIPYHYGTWVFDPYYGWVWVPGYVWAPSWVVFRTGPDYIGWAPVSPGFSIGASFGYGAPVASSFVFVPAHSFLAPRIRTCYVPQSRATVIINNTRIVNNLVVENNVVVNRGPDRRFIEQASGRRVREEPIERVSRALPGPRVSRSQLRVDPVQERRGLRAAEPVSAETPLPEIRRRENGIEKGRSAPITRESTTADAPRASRRLSGNFARQHEAPTARESSVGDSPRVTRREMDDIERQRGGSAATRGSATTDAPRASQRLSRDTRRQGGLPAAKGNSVEDSPRVMRRERDNIERQRGGAGRGNTMDAPRAGLRVTEDTGRQRGFPASRESSTVDAPRGSRRMPHEGEMKRQETLPRVYREQPGAQNRIQRPPGSDTIRQGRASSSDAGSIRQSTRVDNSDHRPDNSRQGASRNEEPLRVRPGKGQGKKPHGSGKQ